MSLPAILALADGTVFHGSSIGASGLRTGEVVFNTAMTGFQEILSNPSSAGQIVSFTCPHVGNTGCTPLDDESDTARSSGLVVRAAPGPASNWRSQSDFGGWLVARDVVAIAGVDTRKLTGVLRDGGTQAGCLMAGPDANVEAAIAAARAFPGLVGRDLVREVTCAAPYEWQEGPLDLAGTPLPLPAAKHHVVVYDFGVQRSLLRVLVAQACRLTVVPAQTSAAEVLALRPDGVVLSAGPGDPRACGAVIAAISELLAGKVPLFGIGLGHQLLALAAGAKVLKLPFGQHGANHPVRDLDSGRVLVTSQAHDFAVDAVSLPDRIKVTHRSLFDGGIQGISVSDIPAFGFQGYVESDVGPHSKIDLFTGFFNAMSAKSGEPLCD